jgi:NNP family nitrate/nitrite transporter-like MFS transporter
MNSSQRPDSHFHIGPILILMLMVLYNFLSRGVFSPLLPILETEFGVSHGRSSSLFLIMSLSMSSSMVFSGFVSSRLQHRGVILLYEFMLGFSLMLCAFSSSFLLIQLSAGVLGLSAGLYAPSGLASVTNLASRQHWGKAISLHETGPNFGLILAPLLVAFAAPLLGWRWVLILIGVANWLNGLLYFMWGRGGAFHGEPPNFKNLKLILNNRAFWIMALFLVLAASSAIGIYSILPTYLISEKGMGPKIVNSVVGFSRVSAIAFVLGAGFLTDKFGLKTLLGIILSLTGGFALLLGVLEGTPLLIAVFFQPMIVATFFPVFNTSISNITTAKTRNVAFSLIIPFASAIGAGATPTIMGFLGERGHFATAFIGLGILCIAATFLLPRLHLQREQA